MSIPVLKPFASYRCWYCARPVLGRDATQLPIQLKRSGTCRYKPFHEECADELMRITAPQRNGG